MSYPEPPVTCPTCGGQSLSPCLTCGGMGIVPADFAEHVRGGKGILDRCDCCQRQRQVAAIPQHNLNCSVLLCSDCWPLSYQVQRSQVPTARVTSRVVRVGALP